jgi:acyl-CoA thioesterase-1
LVIALLLLALGAPAGSARAQDAEGVVVFFGDSLTAGYGLDPELAFPTHIQEMIDAAGWSFEVVNAGVSGETTSGGLRRIDWILRQKFDVLVLELGGNDGLRGTDLDLTESNLRGIIERARAVYPDLEIVLAGMQVPPNLGAEYTGEFAALYPRLAAELNTHLIPFLLDGVGGVRALNLVDGIHPNAAGHELVATTVWTVLEPVLSGLIAGR